MAFGRPGGQTFKAPGLPLATLLILLSLLGGCVGSRPEARAPVSPPIFPERELYLVFERESDYSPLTGKKVKVRVSSPARLLHPEDGEAVTDERGAVRVAYAPVSRYDLSALGSGDLIIDYPCVIYLTMEISPYRNFEWQVDDSLSFASYGDPLYAGLDRTPERGPFYVNLFLP